MDNDRPKRENCSKNVLTTLKKSVWYCGNTKNVHVFIIKSCGTTSDCYAYLKNKFSG